MEGPISNIRARFPGNFYVNPFGKIRAGGDMVRLFSKYPAMAKTRLVYHLQTLEKFYGLTKFCLGGVELDIQC
jgi:hypothetical protein